MVKHVEFLVEEPSMAEFLCGFVPRVAVGLNFDTRVFQAKDAMMRRLQDRLQGYANWLPEDWRIILLVDRDDDDCIELKDRLNTAIRAVRRERSGKQTSRSLSDRVISRIVIEELEAWYFGDWKAVRQAYPRVSSTVPSRRRYRDPDGITGGTWEALERELQKVGYFTSGIRKIELARTLAPLMDPDRNTSHSFQVWLRTMRSLSE